MGDTKTLGDTARREGEEQAPAERSGDRKGERRPGACGDAGSARSTAAPAASPEPLSGVGSGCLAGSKDTSIAFTPSL